MEFVKFIVNLYTCITVFLSSELLSNVFFLFFHKCLYLSRCDDKQTFIVFYFLFKKKQLISNFTVDSRTGRWGKLEVIENRKLFQFQIII